MTANVSNTLDPMGRIVVGIDGKQTLPRSALWAADLAQRQSRGLVIVAAHHDYVDREELILSARPSSLTVTQATEAAAATASAIAGLFPEVAVEAVVAPGDPSEILAAASKDASLVVMGASTMSTLAAAMLGRATADTVKRARGPVAIIPDREVKKDGPMVLAVDLLHPVDIAADYAFSVAQFTDRPLEVVYAHEPPKVPAHTTEGVYDLSTGGLKSTLIASVAKVAERYPQVPVSYLVIPGTPSQVLLTVSDRARAIIMGSRGWVSGLVGVIAGSTSRKLIDHTQCPLVIVPIHG